MFKILLVSSFIFSLNAFSQTPVKPDLDSSVNAVEQIHGQEGNNSKSIYSVKKNKKKIKVFTNAITPLENTTPANCSDSLEGKGGANYTACQGNKK
jgi:hypothetical protein